MCGSTPAIESDLLGTRCPGCSLDLCDLPPQATFCPACGRRLRVAQTVWTTARSLAGHIYRRRPDPVVNRSGPRAPVVVGYGKALWRLGWRYEHGRGMSRNVPEAMRCYHKSAGLGNDEARSRLDVVAGAPIPVLPIDPDATDVNA